MSDVGRIENVMVESLAFESQKDVREEPVQKLFSRLVTDRIVLNQRREELGFVKTLSASLPSPEIFSDQVYLSLILKCTSVYAEKCPSVRKRAEEMEHLTFDVINSIMKFESKMFWVSKIFQKTFPLQVIEILSEKISDIQEYKAGVEDVLDEYALKFRNLTIEEWQIIKENLEKNQIPFSQEFALRCQQVGFKNFHPVQGLARG